MEAFVTKIFKSYSEALTAVTEHEHNQGEAFLRTTPPPAFNKKGKQ
jgi:hypothetical protein